MMQAFQGARLPSDHSVPGVPAEIRSVRSRRGARPRSRNPVLPAAAAALAVFVLAGCGGGGADASGPLVQDSAGVRIITNVGQGAWGADGWRLEEELRIGVDQGDPELQFGMLVGVDADDQGRIVTLDQQATRVRIFDADGTLLRAFGRAGGGPGELSQQLAITTGVFFDAEGAVAVPDMGNMRIARFSPEGEALESPRIPVEQGIPLLFRRAADRSLLVQLRQMAIPGMTEAPEGPGDRIVRLSPGSAEGETLRTMAAGETFTMGPDGMPRFRIFSPEPVWEILSDGRVVTGTNDEYSLALRNGDQTTIVRRAVERRPVSERQRNEMRNMFRQSFEDSGQPIPAEVIEQLLSGIEFEDHWPALSSILAGPEGTLWVQRVSPDLDLDAITMEDLQSGRIGSPDWDVFDNRGEYLGVVTTPRGFVPQRFVGDALYGVHHDELGIQRVVRLALVR